MQSKRSFFNAALFRKNLTRFWPLWGGLSLAGSLAPLYIVLALFSGAAQHLETLDFTYALYIAAGTIVPAASMVYAAACAMLVWGYLFNARAAGLMHTLPVDRTCLFVTTALSGLAMMLIPYVVVGGLTCLIAVFWGFFDIIAAVNTALAALLMTAAFFGLATFCAMLTGSVFALPALYLLANFLAPLLETLLTSLAGAFLIGNPGGEGMFNALSPIVEIYSRLSVEALPGADGKPADYVLRGFGTLALYGLAGIALLAAAWVLYRRRHSECAGDVAAFRGLRPVFRYGLALLSALTLGRMVYELLWGALLQPGLYAQPVPMAACMALTGAVGYYAASMLLEKSLRVFKGSWKGVAIVCAGAAALCAAIQMDVLGVERRTPELEDVAWVTMSSYNDMLAYDAETEPELTERLLEIHRAIVADRERLREAGDGHDLYHYTFTYKLKSGGVFKRNYALWFTEERCADPETYDGMLTELLTDPEVILSKIAVPEGGALTDIMCYDYASGYGVESLDLADCQRLYDAMLLDAREGNVPGRSAMSYDTVSYEFYLEIEYRILDERGVYSHNYHTVWLYPTMEHTIEALVELGRVDRETLAEWDARLPLGGGEIVVP